MISTKSAPRWVLLGLSILIGAAAAHGAGRAPRIDLTSAVVVAPSGLSGQERKAIEMLVDEVAKRSRIRWRVTQRMPTGDVPAIVVGQPAAIKTLPGAHSWQVPNQVDARAEGYAIGIEHQPTSVVVVVMGNDRRGVLFGVGGLLRALHMARDTISLEPDFKARTAPRYPLRGHQLGYRPKTNSYDGWTLALWEQYIRDLAVFGTNAVELIPPRSDDDADSPHFPLPPLEMMAGMSKLLDDYGLDVWIWYPAMDRDYADAATVTAALAEWGEVFARLPRVDAVFVPGGDPGHTRPRTLFALLEKQTKVLHQHHPRARFWVSPQSFNRQWLDEFCEILTREQPAWLGGVVFGPQIRISLPELRARVRAKYPIRRYPDITHSRQCQYPVPEWDMAFALTLARECINPRPLGEARIFQIYQREAIGFITYSEGCNDDVNKIVWSSLGWDPDQPVVDILRDYSGYFVGDRYRDDFAQGLMALERNWRAPLLANAGVQTTWAQFRDMEKAASPQDLLNWRFQQGLYRAYYDAYERSRLIQETDLEQKGMQVLREASRLGPRLAMRRVSAILDRGLTESTATDLRARVHELGEALYQSIRMQLSVPRYQAIAVDRGASLDTIDVALNDRVWLENEFDRLRKTDNEAVMLAGLERIVHWDDPGPGGFYDDLGDVMRQPHLVRGPGFDQDPAFLRSSLLGFTNRPAWRRSWCRHAETLHETPLQMAYEDLDGHARYRVRVVYAGDNFEPRIRLVANDRYEIHAWLKKPFPVRPVEFEIPAAATADGRLRLSWHAEPGRGGNGRGCQVAEVWLIKEGARER